MLRSDLFIVGEPEGPWGIVKESLDLRLLEEASKARLPDFSDAELAVLLLDVAFEEFGHFGAHKGSCRINNDDSRVLLRSLQQVLRRMGIQDAGIPFQDFNSFKTYWLANGAEGKWAAREKIVGEVFSPLREAADQAWIESQSQVLAVAVTNHSALGWIPVDNAIAELRAHFAVARTPMEYAAIGLECTEIVSRLSAIVYEHGKHRNPAFEEPKPDQTKIKFERYIEVEHEGGASEELVKLAKSAVDLSQAVKHRGEKSSRTEAGIAADAVILLANILRRLQEK